MKYYVRLGLFVEVIDVNYTRKVPSELRCNVDILTCFISRLAQPECAPEIALRVTLGIFGSLNCSLQLKCTPKG